MAPLPSYSDPHNCGSPFHHTKAANTAVLARYKSIRVPIYFLSQYLKNKHGAVSCQQSLTATSFAAERQSIPFVPDLMPSVLCCFTELKLVYSRPCSKTCKTRSYKIHIIITLWRHALQENSSTISNRHV